jgi:hypothetical protein
MTKRVNKELEEGLITAVESPCLCTHALGSVPKGHDDFRAIVDCSNLSSMCVSENMEACREMFSYNSVE